jgi:hypothetical protein
MLNPAAAFPATPADGHYDGSTFANSGVMSLDPGQPQSFSLTFTKVGTYAYFCLVHGQEMSGKIIIENPSVSVPSPRRVASQIKRMVAEKMKQVPAAIAAA